MTVQGRYWLPLALLIGSDVLRAQDQLDIRITPANPPLQANIQAYLGGVAEGDEQALRRLAPMAESQAQQASQALGYYQAQIEARLAPGQPPRLLIEVRPGEPVRLREVILRLDGPARQLPAFQLPDSTLLKPGAVLHHGHYEDAKKLIENQAQRYGFFSGHFTRQQLRIDPAAGVADIALIYASGPRYRLGKVSFSGDSALDPALLQRMVPFRPGTAYDAERIAELYQALQGSGYFEAVRVDADPALAVGQEIAVQVQLVSREPRTLSFGLGFSTDVGPRTRANWTRHWANPQGHSYGAELELSAPRQNLGLWYDVPGEQPLTDKFRVAGGYQNQQLADTDSDSRLLTFGPEWHRELASGWQRVLSLKYQHETYNLGDDAGRSSLLMPGVSFGYLRSDNRIDPNRGYRLQVDSAVAKQGLLADTDLWHANLLLKGLATPLPRHRLLGRFQVGGTLTGDYASVPASLRFFAGGDQSVRGYDYQSLSPEDADGERVGGRYLLAGSLEYQYALAERWRVAAFVDQGNAFDSLQLDELKTGVGLGLRWVSPVGPLRLDLAHALDEPGGIRLHFSMGPEL
ncbi:MAG: autotransporter assembly complex family protein [Pseudomonas sp.]|uniref:autotransporter assembly complex protein TamA n=1 Tax=Pseudomonas sp. TaxID=306 RepID=UPI0033943071